MALACSGWARADENADAKVVAQEQPMRWYGWQTLTADGGAVFLFTSALSFDPLGSGDSAAVAVLLAAGTYLFVSPIIHAVHRQGGKALASFGMRLAAPLVGGFLGGAATPHCRDDDSDKPCPVNGALLGAFLGLATAATLDATLLAYEPIPNEPADTGLRWLPAVGFIRDTAWFGVAGAL